MEAPLTGRRWGLLGWKAELLDSELKSLEGHELTQVMWMLLLLPVLVGLDSKEKQSWVFRHARELVLSS